MIIIIFALKYKKRENKIMDNSKTSQTKVLSSKDLNSVISGNENQILSILSDINNGVADFVGKKPQSQIGQVIAQRKQTSFSTSKSKKFG